MVEEIKCLHRKLPASSLSAEGVGVVDFDERHRHSGDLQFPKEFLRLGNRNIVILSAVHY